MRDKNRIKPLLNKLEELWLLCPDYRFGQLIYLIAGELKVNDIFFPEEDKWLQSIQNIIDKRKVNN